MLLDIVKKDSTDRSVVIRIIDATDGTPETGVEHDSAGIDLWYRREGAAAVSITEAALAALTTAHTDGGIEHIGDGYYRLDLPDAAFATGANQVAVGGTVTGMVVIGGVVRLVDYDPENAVRMGMTALPDAAAGGAGGLPTVDGSNLIAGIQGTITDFDGLDTAQDIEHAATLTAIDALPTQAEITGGAYALDTDANGRVRVVDGTGAGEINTAGGVVEANAVQISGDGPAADNLESMLDGGGGATLTLGKLRVDSSDATAAVHVTNDTGHGLLAMSSAAAMSGMFALSTGSAGNGFTMQGGNGGIGLLLAYDTAGMSLVADEIAAIDSAIDALNDLSAADVRAAVGLAAANLDTQIAALPTQAEITGGAYPIDTDANGRVRIVDGTAPGELDTAGGLIAGIAGTKNTLDDLNDITVAGVLTTQMTESYAANGAEPTLAQAIFAIHQHLMAFGITGTAYSVKQLNGSDEAFAAALDDDTNPTSLIRS